ncbi:1,2-phenylacetyl-CoA epoxidase subunit B [Parageobacillus thermoglucosidasius]|uniref:1,2-phenylacetyl-CoA epoxidase subunit PaaB n=1 Tax=Parageobacillus thermoglucosidasius TaxID=1426 RepID=UPI000E11F0AF|nr:1,2-phenylacetyl-CoA epoxidase subunit PaaB [Parageobacillus thermoglucosidasius]RDE31485.1 1,2-phenylacetyl-CoA epoxidase subunit B [Parageobacillus thermoglucosidasius]
MSDSGKGFYQVFEVFSRKNDTAPFQHQFSLLAPNHEIALVMAQENFMRRETVSDIWVVKRSDIRMMTEEEKESLKRLDNKDYRTTKGYGYLKKKWRQYEQQMLDEKEILSWKGEIQR